MRRVFSLLHAEKRFLFCMWFSLLVCIFLIFFSLSTQKLCLILFLSLLNSLFRVAFFLLCGETFSSSHGSLLCGAISYSVQPLHFVLFAEFLPCSSIAICNICIYSTHIISCIRSQPVPKRRPGATSAISSFCMRKGKCFTKAPQNLALALGCSISNAFGEFGSAAHG